MDYNHFVNSLENNHPPEGLIIELIALWYEKKGNWDKAHQLVQNEAGKSHALIHAYLHRKEGDIWNANYWYTRADEKMPDNSLENEWEYLVNRFLG